ncbi:hypothetical protein Fcan01_22699 [Folsomia candida]|uniref:Uncharacterized protein n=1 Tax=Folsomia candida TaxID=158441 RepID=A0A226DBY2_FOLCA|nr:hypothetical protein Fcan01_22699 [Folsomia candida]
MITHAKVCGIRKDPALQLGTKGLHQASGQPTPLSRDDDCSHPQSLSVWWLGGPGQEGSVAQFQAVSPSPFGNPPHPPGETTTPFGPNPPHNNLSRPHRALTTTGGHTGHPTTTRVTPYPPPPLEVSPDTPPPARVTSYPPPPLGVTPDLPLSIFQKSRATLRLQPKICLSETKLTNNL